MRHAQAAPQQQAFAVYPVGFGQGLGDALGHPLGTLRLAPGVDQQGELVAAQARHLIACLELALEPADHLQDQAVTGLVAEGIVGVAEVVQVQVPEGHTAPVVFGQARGQQGLEALAVGNAGQRVLLGQALQGGFEHTPLAHMAQAAAQHVAAQLLEHQPVAHTRRRLARLLLQQQHHGQVATPGRRLQARGGQHQRVAVAGEQAVDRVPAGCGHQHRATAQRQQAFTKGNGPVRPVRQQKQTQRFDKRRQAGSLARERGQ